MNSGHMSGMQCDIFKISRHAAGARVASGGAARGFSLIELLVAIPGRVAQAKYNTTGAKLLGDRTAEVAEVLKEVLPEVQAAGKSAAAEASLTSTAAPPRCAATPSAAFGTSSIQIRMELSRRNSCGSCSTLI